ncbi:fumarylacetoacetate hydrolase family protein [Tenggerimyces flavus]|uniref:Fumarylacetoacetate hydrolase family protein n=1 Tax=Tenggerimyces flavus TaxID=1708749 RepID=A0ABV7YD08_9ACTN|nr:fumarylacetoacetate hydrolase family protein [Tenggerimyces flavus]MBM7788111.1 2-keto-4-pentenoate hydratase/2-oxohepta-3-ene-1,7-dioic acid hydratase in catechol pathway [Tenggerimyces flavus]
MRLLSFERDGRRYHGQLVGADEVRELGPGDLTELLAQEPDFATWTPTTGSTHRLQDVKVVTPIARPGKLLGVAANYQDHVVESGGPPLDRSRISPRLFLMPPTALIGPGDDIPYPKVSQEVDWEAELAVVIGKQARDVAEQDALNVVAGYAASNDVSARSMDYGYPRDTDDKAVWFFDWLAGKWLDGFAPVGPYLITADEIPDPQDLLIELRRNGEIRQQGSTKHMIFNVAELVAHASRLMTLEPGDVILTGTPAGVGSTTGDYLKSGDEVSVSITGPGVDFGILTNRVA